ncbi:MAG: hypothetical protein ACRDHZ_19685 [Ktedonobacteraceae bacterium]
MNCEFAQALADVPTTEIPETTMAQVKAHLETCGICNKTWRMKRLLSATLRASPAPALPEGLKDRLLARVFAAEAERHRRRIAISFGLAAVLVLGLILGFTLSEHLTTVPEYAYHDGTLILQSERPITVGVAFNSGSTLENVRFTIDLPTGMHVAGEPSLHHLSWVGELRKGQNLLKLPIVAHAGTVGLITAELTQGAAHRTFSVSVLAQEPASLGSRLWRGLTQVFNRQS